MLKDLIPNLNRKVDLFDYFIAAMFLVLQYWLVNIIIIGG